MRPARRCTRAAVGCIEVADCSHEQSPTFIPSLGSADDCDLRIEMRVSGQRP